MRFTRKEVASVAPLVYCNPLITLATGMQYDLNWRRGGRVAEGGSLLRNYRVYSSIVGSNPTLSASF